MSSSDPGQAQPRAQRPVLPPDSDVGTDPGRSQPYETLYRNDSDGPATSHRTTARHFEPALTVSEEQPDPTDRFHWLYRPEPEPELEPEQLPEPEPLPESDSVVKTSHCAFPAENVRDREPGPSPTDPVGGASIGGHDDQPDADRPRRPGVSMVVLIVVVLLALGAGIVAAVSLADQHRSGRGAQPGAASEEPSAGDPTSVVASVPAAPATDTSSDPPGTAQKTPLVPDTKAYVGDVVPIRVARTSADCRAPASTDGAGARVRYDPERLIDGDLSTAWRCEGAGVDRSITFSFTSPSQVAELGLVNGYAKTDPKSHADRYGEYRRIRQVQWTFGDGATFTQDLADQTETMQTMRIPTQTADQVRLTIISSTSPGSKAKSRDAVLISEAAFAAPQT